MAVTLTEAAAKHVQKFLTRRGKGVGLRLGVKTSGCSGMAYKLEFADEVNSDDRVWESFGVKVIVALTVSPALSTFRYQGSVSPFAHVAVVDPFNALVSYTTL